MKTFFILVWVSASAFCNQNGVMSPCEYKRVFETKQEAIDYAKEEILTNYSWDKTWQKTGDFTLWEVQGTSRTLTVSRTIEANESK